MSVSRRIVARLLAYAVAVGALAAGLVFNPPFAAATVRHRTLNDTRAVGSAPVTPDHAIDHFGLVADLDSLTGSLDPRGSSPYGEARFLVDGSWTGWQQLGLDGAQSEGQFTGSLIAVDHATAYQVRNLPEGAHNWRAAAINTTDGPVEVSVQRGPAQAHAAEAVQCRSRADWGANESITAWSKGTDTQVFQPVQVLTVHHTAGSNSTTQDYSAEMRAILSYHVQTQGWSDIGYQYLIDGNGVVYEGRNAGHTSNSCLYGGGDGSDFAHQTGTNNLVTGAHVGGWNSGNLGIALMGCFEDSACTGDTKVPAGSVAGLESLLTTLTARHSLNPQGTVHYINPVNSSTKDVAAISAHLDWEATLCPGANLYPQLPAIRADVAQRLAPPPITGTPSAPTNLTATAYSTNQINLAWKDNAADETGYRVEQSTDGSTTWTVKATLDSNSTSYSDTGLNAGATYWYRIIASNNTGDSGPSNTASATTLLAPPTAPTGLSATASSSTQINLNWSASSGATGYKIERSTDGNTWSQVAEVGAVTTYSNTGLTPATTYYYRVSAFNTGGASTPSNSVSATTLTTPTLHVGNLVGKPTSTSSRAWTAKVTITVLDASGVPLSGVTVTGSWTVGTSKSTATCTTGTTGTCTVSKSNLSKTTVSNVTFAVTKLTKTGYTYVASDNYMTSVLVTKP